MIRLRDGERQEIARLLEAHYLSEAEACSVIARAVAAILARRDSYAVFSVEYPPLLFGPMYGLRDARRASGIDPQARILSLRSPDRLFAALEQSAGSRYCECGHPRFAHLDRHSRLHGQQRRPGCLACSCERQK